MKNTFVRTPLLLLCLIGFAAFFSSYLRMPVMPLYAAQLGAGPVEVGAINGAFMLAAGLLSIPAGLFADRTGRKLPIICGTVAVALSALLVTQCRQPGQMAAAYILFGVGLAAFAPSMLSLVADVTPSNRLGQAYGWYTTAIYVAMTAGPAIGGFLAKRIGLCEVFVVSGSLSLAVATTTLFMLPHGISRHKSEVHSILAGSAGLLSTPWLRACLLATIGSCIGFGVFLTFLPLYAVTRGCDSAQVGMVFAAQALTNVVCRIPIGKLVDRGERRRIVAAGLLCLSVALAALGGADRFGPMIACAILLGIGMALTYTAIGALIAGKALPAQRGLAMGMYNSCIYLGMMFGSTAFGVALKKVGYPYGFIVAGGVVLLTRLLFGVMMQKAE
ncbi:MAG: MFS transporter [Desulfuromonadaceae bacterium]|nr:MFS transporter [Desulfuromonadaceae bacterium]MDD5105120.1 MFS transporter [Desulfuromonadaceae bacterium]